MHRPLHEHLLLLEDKLQDLRAKLTADSLPDAARERILAQIKFADDALSHYRQAIELEFVVNTGDTGILAKTPGRLSSKVAAPTNTRDLAD